MNETDGYEYQPSRLSTAVGWSYVMDAGTQVTNTVITFVLASLVGPTDFGVLSLAMVYVLLLDTVQRQGMAAAIIQRRDLDRAHVDTAFWMIAGFSVFLTGVSFALAGWWADVNNAPSLAAVVRALSLILPIGALSLVQDALMRRAMKFRALAMRLNVAALLGGAAGVAAALGGLGVWALVIQQLTSVTTSALLLWWMSPWRPRLTISSHRARELLGFSTGSFLTSLGVFVNNRADAILSGIFFGSTAVGLYRLGARLVDQMLSFSLSGRSMMAVALPELSRHQDTPEMFAARSRTLLHLATVTSVPLLGILAACARPLTRVLGPEWEPAASAMQVLCIVGVARALMVLTGPILQALGRPHRQALLTWIAAALSAGSFILVGLALRDENTSTQVLGMAVSRAALYGTVMIGITIGVMVVIAHLSVRELLVVATPSLGVAALAFVSGSTISAVTNTLPAFVQLCLVGTVASAVSGAALLIVDREVRVQGRAMWERARGHRARVVDS